MSIVVVATIRPNPADREAVVAAVREAIPQVHGEPGCELYALHLTEDRLVMIEKWSDREALDVHMTAPALAVLGPRLEGRLAAPIDIVVLDPAPAGSADKGAL